MPRLLNVFFQPKKEWTKIGSEKDRLPETYVVLAACSLLMGLLFWNKGFGEIYYETAVWFASIHLACILSWIPYKLFENKITYTALFKVLVYTSIPFILSFALGLALHTVKLCLYIGLAVSFVMLYNAIRLSAKPFSLFDALMYAVFVTIVTIFANYFARVCIPVL